MGQVAQIEQDAFLKTLHGLQPIDPFHQSSLIPIDEQNRIILESVSAIIQNVPDGNAPKFLKEDNEFNRLQQWQEGKNQHIPYSLFSQTVSRIKAGHNDFDSEILLREYIFRLLSQYNTSVSEEDMQRFLSTQTRNTEQEKSQCFDEGTNRALTMLYQMRNFGVDNTHLFYKHLRLIQEAMSPKDIDIEKTDLMQEYEHIRSFFLSQKDAEKSKDVLEQMTDFEKKLMIEIGKKKMSIAAEDKKADALRTDLNPELSAELVAQRFEEGYDYLSSLIPQDQRKIGDKLPYHILKFAMHLRSVFPVANTEALAQIWWQLRLGGARAKDIYTHLAREMPAYVREHSLKKYAEYLFDNYLSSEAGGYECQKNISITENVTPNDLLFQTMKNLIHYHIPKNQEYVRFTLIGEEQKIRKLIIPYHEGISDSEIQAHIEHALISTQWKDIDLSDREKADLSYISYNAKEREKNRNYAEVYKSFGRNQETDEEYSGDYIIQIGSPYEKTRDPRSLFAVDSHKAAVQLQMKEAGKVRITARYNHSSFDGAPADIHSDRLFEGIAQLESGECPNILSSHENTIEYQLAQAIHSPEASANTSALPLIEAQADYEDREKYEKKVLGDSAVITPTEMRGLVLAHANNIQHYQYLVAGYAKGAYFSRNPNANNIQPVVIAPEGLTKDTISDWAQKVRKTVSRAKKSVGDVALFSSIAGQKEGVLSMAGSWLNPTLTNMLCHTQGMVSALQGVGEDVAFTTAVSNAYTPAQIDLQAPVPSMGVLGLYLHKDGTAHYTCRITPSQAQAYFRDAVLHLCASTATEKDKKLVLKKCNKIMVAWDQLISGGVSGKKMLSLTQYEQIRNAVWDELVEMELLSRTDQIQTGDDFQIYLNTTLQHASEDILDKEKLLKAKKELDNIFTVS